MNILVISFFYPPVTKPRAVQVARLMSASSGNKLVFCGEGGQPNPIAPDEEGHVRVSVPWTMPPWRKSVHSALRWVGGSMAGTWEPYEPWMRRMLKTVPQTLCDKSFRPDAIATFGHPWVDHEIGLSLKRSLGAPWIAHFSDPWVDNPLVGLESESARSALRKRESAVMHAADRLIFTSKETIDLVMANYPDRLRRRAAVLPHCFDPTLFPSQTERDAGAIRCLGKFYGDRKPDVLIESLARIERERPGRLAGYTFEIIGNYDPALANRNLETRDLVQFRPAVPYLESLRLMSSAEGLFLIDAPSNESVFLPSKLVEYIGARRPIFGITPPGTADRLIRRCGGMTADPSDVAGVARMIDDFLNNLPRWTINEDIRNEFTMETVGKRFDVLVTEVVEATGERMLQ